MRSASAILRVLPLAGLLAGLTLALGLAACTTSGTAPPANAPMAHSGKPIPVDRLPPGVADDPAAGDTQDYRIGALDTLDISVFGVPDLNRTLQVSGSGQIDFPLIGSVQAAGRTAAALKADLETRLGAKYLQSPQVSVSVKESTSQRVTVEGAVKESGIYPLIGETTLLQSIALAKGLEATADPHGVLVFRKIDGRKNVASFDLTTIEKGKATDPVLQGGDVVVVDQSGAKAAWAGLRSYLPIAALFAPLL